MKHTTLTSVLAAAALLGWGFAAEAGPPSWPNVTAKKFDGKAVKAMPVTKVFVEGRRISPDGLWEDIGGDTGWMPRQHIYVLGANGFEHAADCPLVASLNSPAPPVEKGLDPSPGG